MVHTVRVQVPFPAPKKQVGISLPAFLCGNGQAEPYRFSGTGAFALAKALLSAAKYVQLSRFHGISLPAFLCGNGLEEPYRLAVRVRLL